MSKTLYALYADNGESWEDNQVILVGVFSSKGKYEKAKEVANKILGGTWSLVPEIDKIVLNEVKFMNLKESV